MTCAHSRKKVINHYKWKTSKTVYMYRYRCLLCGHRWTVHRCKEQGKEVDPRDYSFPVMKKPRNFTHEEIKAVLLDKRSCTEIAKDYGATSQTISAMQIGRTYRYLWPEIERRVPKPRHRDVEPKVKRISCNQCTYWSKRSCSFDFPDAGGFFAEECSLFSDA